MEFQHTTLPPPHAGRYRGPDEPSRSPLRDAATRPPALATQCSAASAPAQTAQTARRLAYLLPGFGLMFGASVLALGILGAALDADQSASSLLLRLALVVAGLLACRRARPDRDNAWRIAVLYLTLAMALAVNAHALADGLRGAMPALLAWLGCAGFLVPRPSACARMLAPTALLYGALGAACLPWAAAVALLAACATGMLCAALAGTVVQRLWHATWQREARLLHACHHDSLSGALARGYLMERLAHDVALARRHGRPLALAMLDLDHFKRVNDLHGHAAGDAVIRALVATCGATLRATDYVGRVGGEEFVCVMPETGADEALACAERIRSAFAGLGQDAAAGLPLRCTVSIGVAVLSADAHPDADALLRNADAALYRAKAAGRDRTVLATPARAAAATAG